MTPVLRSQAVLVVGMHRSGTSTIARALVALGVYLGSDFLEAQPENPRGYWEDKGIVGLNEWVLHSLRSNWDDVPPIDRHRIEAWKLWRQRLAAAKYVRQTFGRRPLWGFKDPRTIRVLPFWQQVMRKVEADDTYVLAVRNPRSVAASLYRRQQMDTAVAYRLWLNYTMPFLQDLLDKNAVVVDYDLLVQQPRLQVERISRALHLPARDRARSREVDRFVNAFVDEGLRHSRFAPQDIGSTDEVARTACDAYVALQDLANDRLGRAGELRIAAARSRWRRLAIAPAGSG